MADIKNMIWDEAPVDVTAEANFIWSIANKLRGSYMPDKYGDVIIPMVIIRRFECTLADTKQAVVDKFKENPLYPYKAMCRVSGYQFYNTSEFDLKELCNDADHIASNFNAYIAGFSNNVQDILNELEMKKHIEKMDKDGCLYAVVKAFSELDLNPTTYDSIKMGYIFENLVGRFYQNVDAGQFYTGRDIVKLCVSLLIAEGCDDIFDDKKILTVCDQACGTGGMLSTAYTYLKHFNPTADVRLFGQEFMGPSYAVGLAEMLIKGQNAENFRHTDTLKNDCFPDIKMRFLLENPPFGTSWSGESAKAGQEDAVKAEHNKGLSGRWGAGLPAGNDAQLIFMQSAVHKMDDNLGRAAIISNGSPLFAGNTASGESQIRRWLLENDLIEAIIQLPTESFYNTPIVTYIWLLSKNKRPERKGKIQLIDASAICHKLRKPLGNKKNEFLPEDRAIITKLYADFADADVVQIYDNTEFLYKEYTVMQPLQRSYSITEDSIANMLQTGTLKGLYDGVKVAELEDKGVSISGKEQTKLDGFRKNKPVYDAVLEALKNAISTTKYLSVNDFMPVLNDVLEGTGIDAKLIAKIADGLSVMDKEAEIQRETKGKNRGEIIYDKTTKDTEIIKWDEDIDDYMAKEVLPYVPDAKWFWEENLTAKKPTIKTGAEIPFTRYFSKYQEPTKSGVHLAKFNELEKILEEKITNFNNSLSIAITGLNSDVKMKESGVDWVGSIPEHWRFEKGKYHFTNNKFIPGVDSCKYQRLSLTLNGVLPRSKDDADGLQPKDFDTYQLLKKGELVFKLIDLQNVSTSRIGLAHDTGLVSPAYIVLHAKEDVLPEYIQYFYLMMWHREIFNALGDNGVRSSLSASDLLNVRIPIPPMDEQIAIANYLYEKNKEIDEILSLMQTQLAELIKYKKAFIGMNVTGKKEVPENV